jgi:hypothetical protein
LADSIQQIHSFRASGVMSSHVANALALEVSAFFRSVGRSWTTPPEIAFLLKASLASLFAPAKSNITSHPFVAGMQTQAAMSYGAEAAAGEPGGSPFKCAMTS